LPKKSIETESAVVEVVALDAFGSGQARRLL
jgi:hypothetical protein